MSAQPATYDLMLLLDPQGEQESRARILEEVRTTIEAQGELLRHDPWGERPLAYPIAHKASAEYHLFQFHAQTPETLAALGRFLRIADVVVRFRIVKLAPGTPEAPKAPSIPPAGPPARRGADPEAAPQAA